MLSETTLQTLDSYWAATLGSGSLDISEPGVYVVPLPAADGSEYAHLFLRHSRLQIACSESLLERLREIASTAGPHRLFDAALLGGLLADRVSRVIGPAYLGYRDTCGPTDDADVRLLGPADAGLVAELRRHVTGQEWEHGGLHAAQPMAGRVVDGRLVSAAGYDVWGGRLAHIGVVTRQDRRAAGHGRSCVRAIARHAVGNGLIAQYRTLYGNTGAMGIAHALGFEHYGSTIYVVATATT